MPLRLLNICLNQNPSSVLSHAQLAKPYTACSCMCSDWTTKLLKACRPSNWGTKTQNFLGIFNILFLFFFKIYKIKTKFRLNVLGISFPCELYSCFSPILHLFWLCQSAIYNFHISFLFLFIFPFSNSTLSLCAQHLYQSTMPHSLTCG